MDAELRRANAVIAGTRRLQAAIGAMLSAQSIDDLDRTILDVLPGAIGFERVALLAPPSEQAPARMLHALGYPALDLSAIPKNSPLAAGGAIDAVVTGEEDDDELPHGSVRGAYLLAPLRESGRIVGLLYADTLREDVEPADAAAGVAYALEIAGIVRANLSLAAERDRLVAELDGLARTDSLTTLPNRRVLEERLEDELRRSARSRRSFALAIADLDHFKAINDGHGHPAGDQALQAFAGVLRAHARQADFVARFAGDEFAVILIDADPLSAKAILERMLHAVRDIRLPSGLHLSASVGVTLSYPVDSAETIIERADAALYQAKQAGRDRAVVA
ncbi:MAG TPA: GGDEF domain-containing protein [Candidatus Baltobacteraceae bacterium]|nr:GGDEF domain-containing protein [Candidatus Baltobacteraceae bacterium]